jgi:hypothetical protein
MGTMISLDIGRFEIDYGKNDYYFDHSALFQAGDRKKVTYYYANNEQVERYGYSKTLGKIKDRLDLIGYSLKEVEKEFYKTVSEKYELSGFLKFDKLLSFVKTIDIDEITRNGVDWEADYDIHFGLGYLINYPKFQNLLPKRFKREKFGEEDYNLFHPYLLLRLLAENPRNQSYDVIWEIGDTINSGWVRWKDVRPKVTDNQSILVVTEGTTDTKIINRAMDVLYPHVSDIFRYIDMQDNYPFTGTGELTKFYKGLAKIRVQNRMLFIFDNDTDGISKYIELRKLTNVPSNLVVCHLPNLDCFNNFLTIGPTGESYSNINGLAVSIECFLDFSFGDTTPIVRWGGFNEKMKQYQGSLSNKDSYTKQFTPTNLSKNKYNLSKLEHLLKHLIKQVSS